MLSLIEIERLSWVMTDRFINHHDREDARQEFRIAVWSAMERVDPNRDPRPYQIACGRNAVRAFFNTSKRHRRLICMSSVSATAEDRSPTDFLDSVPGRDRLPSDIAHERDLVRRLRTLVKKLPPRQRTVIQFLMEGMEAKEISAIMGVTTQFVYACKLLARRRLENRIKPTDLGKLPEVEEHRRKSRKKAAAKKAADRKKKQVEKEEDVSAA